MLLITMRLADMKRVHPQQITGQCAECGHEVGIYPSGQKAIKHYPGKITVVCQVCRPPGEQSQLAPGAEFEPFQSIDRDRK